MAWNIDPSSGQDIVWDEEGTPVAQAIGPNWPVNAPLIAAAPNMLEALKGVRKLLMAASYTHCDEYAPIVAAIAKAEGRS